MSVVYIGCVSVVPLSVSRQRITCLGAMRPCIRQVELQGEFCNTWPVSLSHLCGWRKREKDEEGEGKQARGGHDGGGQHKWLGMIGRNEWQWKVIERGRENNSWGSRREKKWDDRAFIFLSFFLARSLSLRHLSIPVLHPAACQADPAESPPLLITHPFNLKGHKHKPSTSKCKNIKLNVTCVCVCHVLLGVLEGSSLHTY